MSRASRFVGLAVVLSGLAMHARAFAQSEEGDPPAAIPTSAAATGFELGARLGYGLPAGNVAGGSGGNAALSNVISGMVPIQLDLGYRLPGVTVGGYAQYGFGFTGNALSTACDFLRAFASGADVSCSTRDLRVGAQLLFHLGHAQGKPDPWLGFGAGYEWLRESISASLLGQSSTLSATVHGFEFANLQGGVDFPAAPGLGIGPFASVTFAEYRSGFGSCSGDCSGVTVRTAEVTDKSLHQWFIIGVHGAFVL